jgi:hypothetical protein
MRLPPGVRSDVWFPAPTLLTLFENQKPGLDHFCIAIEDFKAEAVMDQLNRQGLKPRRPSGTDRIYFPDPDEIEVQVSAVDHHA